MPCYSPLSMYRSTEFNEKSGKFGTTFDINKSRDKVNLKPPCGQCMGCRLDRSQSWALRCMQEASLHSENCMVTLTYRNEDLPWDLSLVKEHHQKFVRSLRDRNPDKTIRYLCGGEYGKATLDNDLIARPHYHICLFGIEFPDKEIFSESEGLYTYTSEILEEIWGKGFCTITPLTFNSAAYVARYCLTKVTGDAAEEHYQRTCETTGNLITIQPEYGAMSNKPALGKDWYQQYKNEVFPSDFIVQKGRKIAVPRYFDKLYQITDPDKFEAIKYARKQCARKQIWNNTPERLLVREKVKRLQMKNINRKL